MCILHIMMHANSLQPTFPRGGSNEFHDRLIYASSVYKSRRVDDDNNIISSYINIMTRPSYIGGSYVFMYYTI